MVIDFDNVNATDNIGQITLWPLLWNVLSDPQNQGEEEEAEGGYLLVAGEA